MMRTALRALAILVAIHGALFAGTAWLTAAHRFIEVFPGADYAYFFGVVAPALILAAPLTPLLWRLGLMNAPGWFAWPRPLGFALVYVFWVLALLGASYLAGALARRSRRSG